MKKSFLNLRSGLEILELEDRLEMVQLSALSAQGSRRCDRNDDPQEPDDDNTPW